MSARADGSIAWSIVVLNRGWRARTLLPEARWLAEAGDRGIMLVYVVRALRRPRRAWLWHGRRVIRRALGPDGATIATSLTLSASVEAGVGLVARAAGGAVLIQLGDAARDAELRAMNISRFAVDLDRPDAVDDIFTAGPGLLRRR